MRQAKGYPMKPDPQTGRGGWPLVPSLRFPGETCLACPRCNSRNVVLSCAYPVRGSGPGGRGRLGDPGTKETNTCADCGERT
jgi:hypothetical protein